MGRAAQLAWKLLLGGAGAVACATVGEGRAQTSHAATQVSRDASLEAPHDAAAVDAQGPEDAVPDNPADAGAADAGPAARTRNLVPIYSATVPVITLKVFFAPHSTTITETGKSVLDAVAVTMKHKPFRIDVEGHASKDEGRAANRLARTRAEKVRDWLVKLGVAKERMTVSSHGYEQPISSEDKGNRCVRFIITAGATQ